MASEYTPTDDEVRKRYAWGRNRSHEQGLAEFDRWLAKVRQEAKAGGWDEGVEAGFLAAGLDAEPEPNPYRADRIANGDDREDVDRG